MDLPKKSIWKPTPSWNYFCPHCEHPRRLPFHPSPFQAKRYVQLAMTTAVFVAATYSWFEWKGIVAALPFWMIFEITYRFRTRMHLSCQHCGFDPYLYMSDSDKALKEIESFWRKKFAEKGIPYPEKSSATNSSSSKSSQNLV